MATPTTQEVRTDAMIASALSSMVDITEAAPVLQLQNRNIRFQRDGRYQSYADLGKKNILNPKDLEHISITLPGEKDPVHFRKILNTGAAHEVTDPKDPKYNPLTWVKSDRTERGFKAIAWVQTEKDGNTPKLDEKGHAHVVLSFPGWKGNPKDGKPNTLSMHKVGRGELYPPTLEIAAFIKETKARLAADPALKDKPYEVTVDSHSVGAANAIAAALMLENEGITVKRVTEVDPLGATLAERRIRQALQAKVDGKEDTLPENDRALVNQLASNAQQAKAALANLDKVMDKTVTLVPFKRGQKDGKETKIYSRVALLESYGPKYDEYWKQNVALRAQMRENRNNPARTAELGKELDKLTQAMEAEQAKLQEKNLWDTVLGGKRDGAARDQDNSAGGHVFEMDVTGRTPVLRPMLNPDHMHLVPNILDPLYTEGTPITPVKQQAQAQAAPQVQHAGQPSAMAGALEKVTATVMHAPHAAEQYVEMVKHDAHLVAEGAQHLLHKVEAVGHNIGQTVQHDLHLASDAAHHLASNLSKEAHHALSSFGKLVSNMVHADHHKPVQPTQLAASDRPKSKGLSV